MSRTVILKGWLIMWEPGHDLTPEVRWKHPGPDFEKAWKTKAIAVTVRSAKPRRKA
jgi:hypothetical protein